jgi:phage gpG-like protein
VGKRSVTVGFADPYAVFHEFGTKRMARRGMLTTNPERGFNPRPPLLTGESGAARQIR